MFQRERRSWTAAEDQLLRDAIAQGKASDPARTLNPSKWHAISRHIPNRNNKDCRKRWFAKLAKADVAKGNWSPEEDERLLKAIEKYGSRWTAIATVVETRNSDQCAKRWKDTLNPSIDRTGWTATEDAKLVEAVNTHGKVWSKIVKTHFPGRTGLAAKNRFEAHKV
ncbi:transcription factor, Myb superfamily [Lentinula guzmanii]|uniref:Transcription factor, Myb superfamily n=3 Tax=Lentinula TaxID=5352 RepID=A0AA38J214_9AGAR|nr:transcription factor, Myb superfamily [Lentinula guzmanii]KAJ3980257.1 transcription factor, Myb superfamily [Lentinula detonsa]